MIRTKSGHREPTVLSSERIAPRISVEEPLHTEPPRDTTAHLLGERGQIGLGDRPSRQQRRRPVNGRHEDAIGRARMPMHVVIERRSEAVQKGDAAKSRVSRARPVTVTGRARRSTKQPLELFDEDPRKGCDRALAVSEKAAQSLRDGDHPLPHGHRGYDAVEEMRSCLCHPAAVAGGAGAAALAREGHEKTLPPRSTACPAESEAEDAAGKVRPQLPFDVRRDGLLGDRPILEPACEVLCDSPCRAASSPAGASLVAQSYPWQLSLGRRVRPMD